MVAMYLTILKNKDCIMIALLNLLVIILVAGIITWLVRAFIPMPGMFHLLFEIVVLAVVVIYVLQFFSLIPPVLPKITIFK